MSDFAVAANRAQPDICQAIEGNAAMEAEIQESLDRIKKLNLTTRQLWQLWCLAAMIREGALNLDLMVELFRLGEEPANA